MSQMEGKMATKLLDAWIGLLFSAAILTGTAATLAHIMGV